MLSNRADQALHELPRLFLTDREGVRVDAAQVHEHERALAWAYAQGAPVPKESSR